MDVFLVFVETMFSSFAIEVAMWDTVLTIKQKIEMSQGIPVSKQTLFFENKTLQNHLYTIQCNILPNSHLFLAVLPTDFPNLNYNRQTGQLVQWPDRTQHKTKISDAKMLQRYQSSALKRRSNYNSQSPVPSVSSQQIIQWPERNYNTQVLQTNHPPAAPSNSTQEIIQWPEKRNSNYNTQLLQTDQSPEEKDEVDEFLISEDWLSMDDDQALQTEKTQESEYTVEELLEMQDSSVIVTEQPKVASDSFGEAIYGQDSSVIVNEQPKEASDLFGDAIYGQDSSPMVRSNYNELQSFSEIQNQFPPVTNQVAMPLASNSFGDAIYGIDSSVIVTEQPLVESGSFGDIIYGQDSSLIVTDQPQVASGSFGEAIYGQDSSVMVRSNYNELRSFSEVQHHFPPVTNQVVKPLASDTVQEIIDIPGSPVKKKIKIGPRKITVMIMPFQEENKRVPVEVNARDKVEELRNKLAKLQEKGQINLPPEGYIFIHKQTALDQEHQSFWWYQVAHGDTIEIFRAHYV